MKKLVIAICIAAFMGCSTTPKNASQQQSATATHATATTVTKTTSVMDDTQLSCKKGNEVRMLEVVKKNNGCTLEYTKIGKTNAVATSNHGLKHCLLSKTKIKTKLEKAGFTCS